MAKKKSSTFECQHCGEQSAKWLGNVLVVVVGIVL